MYKFEEIYEWMVSNLGFEKNSNTENLVKKYYDMIQNPAELVNGADKEFVTCESSSELNNIKDAILGIILDVRVKNNNPIGETEKSFVTTKIADKIGLVCEELYSFDNKPRIPFYIMVLLHTFLDK